MCGHRGNEEEGGRGKEIKGREEERVRTERMGGRRKLREGRRER